MLELERDLEDDDAFLGLVARLIDGVIESHQPARFHTTKIDNWFGGNWLAFNHKILGAAGSFMKNRSEPCLVPPFTPSRVLAEAAFARDASGTYVPFQPAVSLHQHQSSEDNARRDLNTLADGAALFWWSARSAPNGRGTVMSYLPGMGGHSGWYAAFKRTMEIERARQITVWQTAELHGVTRPQIDRYLKAG
jgi:hypothetical protein